MKLLCCLLCVGLMIATGCRKRREAAKPVEPATPIPAAPVQPDASSAVPTPAPPPAGTPQVAASVNVQHFNQMSEALLKFRRDKNRAPQDWQELMATGYLKQLPTAPPGKRYVFDRSLNVRIVNQ